MTVAWLNIAVSRGHELPPFELSALGPLKAKLPAKVTKSVLPSDILTWGWMIMGEEHCL